MFGSTEQKVNPLVQFERQFLTKLEYLMWSEGEIRKLLQNGKVDDVKDLVRKRTEKGSELRNTISDLETELVVEKATKEFQAVREGVVFIFNLLNAQQRFFSNKVIDFTRLQQEFGGNADDSPLTKRCRSVQYLMLENKGLFGVRRVAEVGTFLKELTKLKPLEEKFFSFNDEGNLLMVRGKAYERLSLVKSLKDSVEDLEKDISFLDEENRSVFEKVKSIVNVLEGFVRKQQMELSKDDAVSPTFRKRVLGDSLKDSLVMKKIVELVQIFQQRKGLLVEYKTLPSFSQKRAA
ncbi:MAG: hypothetical protein KC548_02435 [Nanoarchaeota archaeon]|nr:hypothetical protein [Nanoarchaeota archaeon]